MTKPPNTETILSEGEVADLRVALEETIAAADVAEVQGHLTRYRALCNSHEVLRRKLAECEEDLDDVLSRRW